MNVQIVDLWQWETTIDECWKIIRAQEGYISDQERIGVA